MMKRLVLAIGVVVALFVMAAPAGADQYPPTGDGAPPPPVEQPVSAPPEAPPEAPSGALPVTGDDSAMLFARAGVVMLAVGGLVLLAARRRRASFA